MQISQCPGVTTLAPFSSARLAEIIGPAWEHTAVSRGHQLSLAFLHLQARLRGNSRSRHGALTPPLIPSSYVTGCQRHLNTVPTGTSPMNKGDQRELYRSATLSTRLFLPSLHPCFALSSGITGGDDL